MAQIGNLLDEVESNEIILPEFQREYVWGTDQAKELMNSLYKEYPIGSLLIWKTENPPEIKNDAVDRNQYGLFKVLLDGQQRLTVLHMLTRDEIPPYYNEEEIQQDPRNLYFNLDSGRFQYENQSTRIDPEWVKVIEVFNGNVEVFSVAREKVGTNHQDVEKHINQKAEHYLKQLSRLQNITKLDMPVEELPKSANIHQSINLFHLVNDQGTELGEAELALAHMSAQWPHIRRRIKEKQKELAQKNFDFGLEFYVKCIIATITKSMTYEKVYDTPKDILVEKWERIEKSLDYLFNLLENEAHVPDSSYIGTRAVLIPFVTYIDMNDIKLTHKEKASFLKWMYVALMWSRYGGSTDTRLDKDISFLSSNTPTKELTEEVISGSGRIKIQPSDLDKKGKRSKRFYNMVRIVTRANEPVDWETGEPLKGSYRLESHHIFPKSKLYDNIYSSKDYLGRKRVNEIANRAFITPQGNKSLKNTLPENYLPRISREQPEALEKQFIPEKEELWKLENYEEFLAWRRKMLAEAINDYIESLEEPGNDDKSPSVEELISKGENPRIEFKETLLYDVYRDQPNKELKYEVVKEICALANSDGGALIIGVKDENKEIKGLNRDLKLMKKGEDEFGRQLHQAIIDKVGDKFASLIPEINFEEVDSSTVCVVSVEPSPEPVFFEDNDFYVRIGTMSKHLPIKDAMEYIEENWD